MDENNEASGGSDDLLFEVIGSEDLTPWKRWL